MKKLLSRYTKHDVKILQEGLNKYRNKDKNILKRVERDMALFFLRTNLNQLDSIINQLETIDSNAVDEPWKTMIFPEFAHEVVKTILGDANYDLKSKIDFPGSYQCMPALFLSQPSISNKQVRDIIEESPQYAEQIACIATSLDKHKLLTTANLYKAIATMAAYGNQENRYTLSGVLFDLSRNYKMLTQTLYDNVLKLNDEELSQKSKVLSSHAPCSNYVWQQGSELEHEIEKLIRCCLEATTEEIKKHHEWRYFNYARYSTLSSPEQMAASSSHIMPFFNPAASNPPEPATQFSTGLKTSP